MSETPTKRLVCNPVMIEELLKCCQERLNLGDQSVKSLTDKLNGIVETQRKFLKYHSECRKPLMNKIVIQRLQEGSKKRDRSDSPLSCLHGPGRPSSNDASERHKRYKVQPKEKVCLFNPCSFCHKPSDEEPLHQVYSDNMGDTLLQIKLKTTSDQVRACVSDLMDSGDASAFEKHYHRKCLRSAQRTCIVESKSNASLIQEESCYLPCHL